MIKSKLSDLDKMKIEEQKRAVVPATTWMFCLRPCDLRAGSKALLESLQDETALVSSDLSSDEHRPEQNEARQRFLSGQRYRAVGQLQPASTRLPAGTWFRRDAATGKNSVPIEGP